MTRTKYTIPLVKIRKILEDSGAGMISSGVIKEFHRRLTNDINDLVMRANRHAFMAGREKVTGTDVRNALRELFFKYRR